MIKPGGRAPNPFPPGTLLSASAPLPSCCSASARSGPPRSLPLATRRVPPRSSRHAEGSSRDFPKVTRSESAAPRRLSAGAAERRVAIERHDQAHGAGRGGARRRRDRRRDGGGGCGARPRAARRLGGALRKGRLRLGHHVQVLEAHPRGPAVPRAIRLASRARVPAREEDARAPGASPRAPAAVPRPHLSRVQARAHHGADRDVALRPAHARQGGRPVPGDAPGRGAVARADDPPRGSARGGLLHGRPPAVPRAALPRERPVRDPPRRARPQLL